MHRDATTAGFDDGDLVDPGDHDAGGAHPPAQIGRFVVRGRLGEGGMGVVYDAWDPELKRRVAVKLLRPALRAGSRDTGAGARLQREAESMARVSHPNVAHIYEVGTHDDAVFLAVEFIEGDNLREWLARRPRGWREVVGVFAQAGHGLAAAHAAGLVHRDFKPDNVLVGADGRVRVVDFGLALSHSVSLDRTLESGASVSVRLTRAGNIVGTPAYMSPEQHLHCPADARSDQFSFCVSLHEALYGARPFAGDSLAELRIAVLHPPTRPPLHRRVPRHLRRLLARGLCADADRRYRDMPALLADLAVDPARTWRILAAVLAVLGMLVAAVLAARPAAAPRCPDPAAALAGVWDDPRVAAARDGLLATGLAYAPDTWPRVQHALDAWAAAWTAARADACEATLVARTAGEELLHLRNQCLDASLRDLDALVATLVAADAATLERALEATQRLPDPATCLDEAAVRARVKPPADPVLAARVAAVRDRLAVASAELHAGHPQAAGAIAREVADAVVAVDHPPLQAEVQLLLGRVAADEAAYPVARDHLLRAHDVALAAAHDDVAAEAAILLIKVYDREHDYAAGVRWSEQAASLITRTGDRPRQRSLALIDAAHNLSGLGRADEAIATAARALALAESALPAGDIGVARILLGAGGIDSYLDRPDAALAHYSRVRDEFSAVLGPDHPLVARAAVHVGRLRHDRDGGAEGPAMIRAAVRSLERSLGPDHPDVARSLAALVLIDMQASRLRDAVAATRRMVEIQAARLGPDHPDITATLELTVESLILLGDHDEAIAAARRLLALREGRTPRDPDLIDTAHLFLAEALLGARRLDESAAACRRVLAVADRTVAPETRARAHHDLARVARLRGDLRGAEAEAARALGLLPGDDPTVPRVQVELGEARLGLGAVDEAAAACTAATLAVDAAPDLEAFYAIGPHLCRGRVLLARGDDDLAVVHLERAVARATAHEFRPTERAEARAALAHALRARDPARSATLLAEARADYTAAGPAFAAEAAARLAPRR